MKKPRRNRIFEEVRAEAIRFLRVAKAIPVGDRPPVLYEIADSFVVAADHYQSQEGTAICESFDPPEFRAVLVREIIGDNIFVPADDLLVCFPPIPGKGSYGGTNIRPSVLFWGDSFWTSILAIEPDRESFVSDLYGESPGWGLDVLYKIDVMDAPANLDKIWESYDPSSTSRRGWSGPF